MTRQQRAFIVAARVYARSSVPRFRINQLYRPALAASHESIIASELEDIVRRMEPFIALTFPPPIDQCPREFKKVTIRKKPSNPTKVTRKTDWKSRGSVEWLPDKNAVYRAPHVLTRG